MGANRSDQEISADTFQEGVAPVQAFTSPAAPVFADTALEARHGRPSKTRTESKPEERASTGVAVAGPAPLPASD